MEGVWCHAATVHASTPLTMLTIAQTGTPAHVHAMKDAFPKEQQDT